MKLFAKLHLIHAPHGRICAAMVTPGVANDSPYLRKMIDMMPPGSGDVLGDSAYGGIKNCNAIRDSGRRPIIDPKSDATPHGFNAKAEMLRFRDEHPGTFYGILRIRNNVKERLFFDEGDVRRGGPCPQDAHPGRRAAVNVHLLQHDLRMKAKARRRRRPPRTGNAAHRCPGTTQKCYQILLNATGNSLQSGSKSDLEPVSTFLLSQAVSQPV